MHSEAMLADALTKAKGAGMLLRFFEGGQRWRVVEDPLFRSSRKRKDQRLGILEDPKRAEWCPGLYILWGAWCEP